MSLSATHLSAAAWCAWALLVAANYPALHPLSPAAWLETVGAPLVSLRPGDLLIAVPRALAAALLLAAQLASAAWFGDRALRWADRRAAGNDGPLFALLLGLGAAGALALGAGLCGLFGAGLYAAVLGVPSVLWLAGGRGPARLATALRAAARMRPAPWMVAGLAAAVAVQAASLVSGLTPPHVSDEHVSHLGLARWYLGNHRVTLQPGNVFSAFPQLGTMLYGAGESFGLEFGIKWIHWAAGWLALAGLLRLVGEAGREVRWIVMLAAATCPVIWIFAGRAFSDLFLAAYGAGAVLACRRRSAVLAGLCAGLAGSCKYTGLLLVVAVVPLLPLRSVPAAAGAAALAAAPWLLRNWLVLANPVHPLLWRIFGGSWWDAELEWRYRRELLQGGTGGWPMLARLPALPWLLPVRNLGSGADGSTGILFALGVPVLFHACSLREALAILAVVVPSVLGGAGIRFLMPVLPLLLAVMARGAARLVAQPRLRSCSLALAAALAWWQAAEFVPSAWHGYDDPLPVVLGREPVGRWLDRVLYPRTSYPFPYSRLARTAVEGAPPGARILFLGGYGGAPAIPQRCIFTPLQSRPFPVTAARGSRDTARISAKFRQLGITHVLVNRWICEVFFDYWRLWDWNTDELDRWIRFWDRYALPVAERGRDVALFALSRRPREGPDGSPVAHVTTPGFECEIVRLGVVLVVRRQFDNAVLVLEDAARRFPGNAQLWMALTMARVGRGEMQAARSSARRARELAPGSAPDLRSRAVIARAEGRLAEAAADLEGVLRSWPDDPTVWFDLAVLSRQLGRNTRASQAERAYWRTRSYIGRN